MDDWITLLSSDLFSDLREIDITGGEPFLRKDLPDLFSGICELKQKNLKALRSIIITTNGFLTDRVLADTEKVAPWLKNENLELVLVCGMDAIGDLHAKIRRFKNAWAKVNQTVEGLITIRGKFSNLIIGLKTTIVPMNVGEMEGIAEYADAKNLFTIISPFIITEGRYLNYDLMSDLAFSQEDIEKMISFFKKEHYMWSFHNDRLIHYFKTGIMKKPCSCGFNYFFVRSTGELFLCPLINRSLGNIKMTNIEALFFSKEASKMRRKIGRYVECQRCTEPGIERYSLPYEGFTYLSLLLSKGRRRFFQLHQHIGLEKYFTNLV